MWGLGKQRSKLGKWLDKNGLTQQDLEKQSKISNATITKVCNDKDYIPGQKTMAKILKAVRKVDPDKKMSDFWDM